MSFDTVEKSSLQSALTKLTQSTKEEAGNSLISEATNAAMNSGKSVYNAVGQLTDVVGVHLPKAEVEAPSDVTMLSGRWWAREAGSMAVTLPLVLLTHKGISRLTEPLAASALEGSAAKAWTIAPQKLALANLTMTGAAYEGIFKPSADNGSSLFANRSKQGVEGGLGFLAMGLVSNKIGSFMGRTAIEGEVPSIAARIARTALPGLGGGAAYGFSETQAKSIFDGNGPAGFKVSLDASLKGAVLGATLSSVGMFRTDSYTAASRETAAKSDILNRTAAERTMSEKSTDNPATNPAPNPANDLLSGLKRDGNLTTDAANTLALKAGRTSTEGSRLASEGEHQAALVQYGQALKDLVTGRGADHPSVANLLSDMARSDMFLGNNARSVQSMESALRINKNAYGEHSPQVAENYDQLSAVYQKGGNFNQAANAMEKSIEARRGAADAGLIDNGSQYVNVLRSHLAQLASLFESAGNSARAQQVRESIPPPPPGEIVPRQ